MVIKTVDKRKGKDYNRRVETSSVVCEICREPVLWL